MALLGSCNYACHTDAAQQLGNAASRAVSYDIVAAGPGSPLAHLYGMLDVLVHLPLHRGPDFKLGQISCAQGLVLQAAWKRAEAVRALG
jgi:hypothetical protein